MSTVTKSADLTDVFIVLGLLVAVLFIILFILLVCLIISYRRYKKALARSGGGNATMRRYLEHVVAKKATSTAFDDVDSVDIYSTQRSHRMGINAPMAFIDMPPIEMYENGHLAKGRVPGRDRSLYHGSSLGGGGARSHRSSHRYVRRQRNPSGHVLENHQSPVAKKLKSTRPTGGVGGDNNNGGSLDMSGRYAAFSSRSDSPDTYTNHAMETDSPERYSQTDDFY